MRTRKEALQKMLLESFGKQSVEHIANYIIEGNETFVKELTRLALNDTNTRVGWRAAWVMATLTKQQPALFEELTAQLIEKICAPECHHGIRHQLLCVLHTIGIHPPIDIHFYDWCLKHAFDPQEKPAVQSLSLKLVLQMVAHEPDLSPEVEIMFENFEPQFYTPALRSTVRKGKILFHKTKKR